MTLLLNYRPVLSQPTGIGVYANAVLPALQQLPHQLIRGGGAGGAAERLRRLAWSQLTLPGLARRQRASLVFTPAPEGYLGSQPIPQVVMVHDLRPISHPQQSLQSLYFRAWVPPLLRQCRHILTNSAFTAAEILRHTGVAAERISVIPLGYDSEAFRPAPAPAGGGDPGHGQGQGAAARGNASPYLLHVGQAYPHKNLRRLIEAFAALARRHPDLRLLLAGKPHPRHTAQLRALVAERGLADRIEFRPYVPFADLPDLYRGALALVYPSLWEGFGLPVLEAMACGTPVLTSRGSGTEEAAGEAALLIDPMDQSALEAALQRLVQEPQLRDRLRQRGLRRAGGFRWAYTATATRQLLESLL
ncbi:MAG: glycosyltransferase family 1 protein [Synechococcus sp.]|nr:glycosyltransferase family 1 protein [Synechococcus sp.]